MTRRRGCRAKRASGLCSFCKCPCSFREGYNGGVCVLTLNRVPHLCDDSGQLFVATGENPHENRYALLRTARI